MTFLWTDIKYYTKYMYNLINWCKYITWEIQSFTVLLMMISYCMIPYAMASQILDTFYKKDIWSSFWWTPKIIKRSEKYLKYLKGWSDVVVHTVVGIIVVHHMILWPRFVFYLIIFDKPSFIHFTMTFQTTPPFQSLR